MSGYVAQVATPQAVTSQQVFRLLSGDENTRCDITDQAVTTGATRLKTWTQIEWDSSMFPRDLVFVSSSSKA